MVLLAVRGIMKAFSKENPQRGPGYKDVWEVAAFMCSV